MEYWLLYFLQDIKDIQALIFVCECMHVYVFKVVLLPLLEIDQCYLYKVWKLINSVVRRRKKKTKHSSAHKEYIQNEAMQTEVLT